MNTIETDRGPAKSLLSWGATQAKGAPAAFRVAGEYSRHAQAPNTLGILAYRQPDTTSRAYWGGDNIDWIDTAGFGGTYESASTPRSQMNNTLHYE